MKSVLVPLDGTKNAEAALTFLEQICSPEDEFVLLMVEKPEATPVRGHAMGSTMTSSGVFPDGIGVYPDGAPGVAGPGLPIMAETRDQTMQRQVDERKDYLEGLASALRTKGHRVKTEVLLEDKPDEAIVEYARKTRPSFIAMLRRTHPGIRELIFGSIATSVVRADVAPVMFVPPPAGAVG
jgi:nucleotide-binding universal stress UspA family protein